MWGATTSEESFLLGHFNVSEAHAVRWGRGEQVMGRNGARQKICGERGASEAALHVEVDAVAG